MKIKTKIIIFYIISIILIFTIFVFISFFLQNKYIDIKYSRAKNYYNSETMTLEDYSTYLINKGFIVTKSEIEPYQGKEDLICHVKGDEIVVYKDNKPILFAVINEKIINDTLLIINLLLIIIFNIIIIILILLYLIIKKYVINRIIILESIVSKYELGDEIKLNIKNYKDEINSLEKEIEEMILKLNIDKKQKVKLAFALSHDLKNPIMKIKAILSMYEKNVPEYKEKEDIIKLINVELKDITEKINSLLFFYKEKNIPGIIETIDLKKDLKEEIKKQIPNMKIKEEGVDRFFLTVDIKKKDIIISNIVSNIMKYSNCKEITISSTDKTLEIKNKIKKKNSNKQTGVGNIINNILAKDINLEIINKTKKDIYIIEIKDIS